MSTADRATSALVLRSVVWLVLAVLGFLLWAPLLDGAQAARGWRALLAAFTFFISLAGGLVVWPAIVRSANGVWHSGIERLAFAALGFSLPSLALLVLLWGGSASWAPWYMVTHHQGVWLENSFLFGRDLAALLLFWLVAARYHFLLRRGRGSVTGAVLIALYAGVFSLLGFDLIMALDPHWYSTLAGAYFFMTGLYIAIVAWAFLAAWRVEAKPEQLHDLGRLIVAFSMIATYLMYAHLLPIWYEVLPHEVRFVAPRMNVQPWKTVSLALICSVYLGPLVFLLTERGKRSRWYLGGVSLVILCGMCVERWWLIAPTFEPVPSPGLAEAAIFVALLGLLGLGMELGGRLLPVLDKGGERERHD
ncbi:hypothetical protein LPW11_21205 [Geomonas sp. RF6]|uniref:hypothetical protein n=1 Tax=Geomonas sp. RF6 TaxID=2897342 RepID=UPI001E3924DD|nr:hypothetical protein [Geomonas sp. RF6]UFS70373.1 hypothetical protein LPW11_21205 [Geomonas sp. RF6]